MWLNKLKETCVAAYVDEFNNTTYHLLSYVFPLFNVNETSDFLWDKKEGDILSQKPK